MDVKVHSRRDNVIIRHPFTIILPVVLAGILIANQVGVLPLWIWCAGCGILTVVAWFRLSRAAVLAALVFFAATITAWRAPTASELPYNQGVTLRLTITDNPVETEKYSRATAIVNGYSDGSRWVSTCEQTTVYFAPEYRIAAGQILTVFGRVSDISSTGDWANYGELLRRRGYRSTVRVDAGGLYGVAGESWSLGIWAAKAQHWAAQHIDLLRLGSDERAVVEAISIGRRGDISNDVRRHYSLSGAAHLLAVSGLHVGIVAMLINGLLLFLGLFRRGHFWRNIIAILVIWVYVFLTGASPSALRAALMFSGAQLAFASSRRYNGLNILLGTAAVMVLLNPNYLYDISFQLSFVAVLGIFALYRPLYGVVKTRWKVLNLVWATVIIGVSATVMTAPLVSHYFGRISLIGIVLNPIVIATAHIIILIAIIWILAPVGVANQVVSWILQWTTWFQNGVVEATALQEWGVWNIRFNTWQTLAIYAIFATIFIIVRRFILNSNDIERHPVAGRRGSRGSY